VGNRDTTLTPKIRSNVDKYTSAIIIGISTFSFMSTVNFLPGAPVFSIFVSLLLFFAAIYKSPKLSSGVLSIIVLISIIYQLTGFQVWNLRSQGLIVVMLSVGALLINLLSARLEATAMAIAVLAVAIMFTPYYYLSVAFIVAAAVVGGLSSIGPVSLTYVLTMIPLLLIENGFLSGIGDQSISSTPVIFTQLVNFSIHMRPPLPGLNILLGWYPAGFFNAQVSEPVINYLSSPNAFLLIVPIVILALVFSLSASMAGIINDMLDRLSVFEKTSKLLKLISPLVASIVTPLAFVILITLLSPKTIGGYETSLTTNSMLSMITASLILGAIFTAREYGIQWLERTEKARIIVMQKIASIIELINVDNKLLSLANAETSPINFGSEVKAIEEIESTMSDIKKGLSTASYETLNNWISELDNNIAPRLKSLPEALRVKVIQELNFLSSLVVTYNNSLNETGLNRTFSDFTETRGNIEYDKALKDYTQLIDEIKSNSSSIFETYKETYNAYNLLTSQPDVLPPVDPARLFESNEYDGGVRLIAEEYWLNFHVKNLPEIESLVDSLIESINPLVDLVDDQTSQKLAYTTEKLRDPKPVNSIQILSEVKDLKTTLDESLGRVAEEITQLEKLVKSFSGISRVISFEIFNTSIKLTIIKERNLGTSPSLRETTKIIDDITGFMRSYRDKKKADESNLVIISQLPVAMKIIGNELAKKRSIEVSSLPFQHKAAITYAEFYAYNNSETRYNDDKEVITRKNA